MLGLSLPLILSQDQTLRCIIELILFLVSLRIRLLVPSTFLSCALQFLSKTSSLWRTFRLISFGLARPRSASLFPDCGCKISAFCFTDQMFWKLFLEKFHNSLIWRRIFFIKFQSITTKRMYAYKFIFKTVQNLHHITFQIYYSLLILLIYDFKLTICLGISRQNNQTIINAIKTYNTQKRPTYTEAIY